MIKTSIVILAAGKSRRMKSSKSKVLHTIADKPLIDFVNDIAIKNSTSEVCYVCSKEVENYIKNNFLNAKTIVQKNRLGTAHAVQCSESLISKKTKDVVVLFGDVPLIENSTIKKLIKYRKKINQLVQLRHLLRKIPIAMEELSQKINLLSLLLKIKIHLKIRKKFNYVIQVY